MNMRIGLLLPAILLGCAGIEEFDTPLPDDGTFATREATPEEQARCDAAVEYAEDHKGRTVLMLQGDEVFCEQQVNGNEEPTPYPLWSGTKTFWCALNASLVATGDVDLDEKVADTLTEFQGDPLKEEITVRDLLTFTSGIQKHQFDLSIDGFKAPEDQRIEDRYARALELPMVSEPGTHFEYGSMHQFVYGAFVQRKMGEDPLTLLEERVLDPIGFRYAGWNKDSLGQPALPYGAWSTAREWAKFMVLLKDRGVWQDERILEEEHLDACLQGTSAMPGYGLSTWLNAPVSQAELDDLDVKFPGSDGASGMIWEDGPANLYMAAGANNQRGYVLPDDDLLVIHIGTRDNKYNDGDFLARAVDGAPRAREGDSGAAEEIDPGAE
jgi:CubicO group peptidase (beta-lactamase class C family)